MQPELDKAKAGALHWRNGVGVDDDLCLEWLFFFIFFPDLGMFFLYICIY